VTDTSIAAMATVVTALGGLIAAISVLVATLRATRRAVEQVHTIVNQQRTDAQAYQVALVTALRDANVAVPADQSLAPPADLPRTAEEEHGEAT